MKLKGIELIFIIIWLVLVSWTLYAITWFTFLAFLFDYYNKPFGSLTFISIYLISISILVTYTKELWKGYHQNNINKLKFSLICYTILVLLLTYLQYNYLNEFFADIFNDIYIFSIWITLMVSSIGIIANRVLKWLSLRKQAFQ